MARRARRAEREADLGEADVVGRLVEAVGRIPARDRFRAPVYDGRGDVAYFVQQFQDVAAANQWDQAAMRLHLRDSLKEGATDCGKPETVDGIFNALRSRFGMTPREARARLAALRRDSRTPLQEHAAEVERLVAVAYEELPAHNRRQMAIEAFCSTLGNAYLQRHLLAVETPTMEDAVRAANEYLTIRPQGGGHGQVRTVEEDEPTGDGANAQVSAVPSPSPMAVLLQTMQQLMREVDSLKAQSGPTGRRQGQAQPGGELRQPVRCWSCGQEGHMKRDCPKVANRSERGPGNAERPQEGMGPLPAAGPPS